MMLTPTTNDNTTAFSDTKLHHQRYQLFLEQKHPQSFIFQNDKFISPFPPTTTHYSLNHLYAVGIIRKYDSVKQYYILAPHHDPTRPLFVPQKALNLNDDFLLPTRVPNFFPKMITLVETPLDDLSSSLHTSLIRNHYSIAQSNLIIAKVSSFILKKKLELFPATTNIPDEIHKALPKPIFPSSTILEISIVPPPTFIQPHLPPKFSPLIGTTHPNARSPPAFHVLQTVNPNVSINSFSCQTDKFVTEILNLLRPHVELASTTDTSVISNYNFDTYRNLQNLFQLHNNDIQTLTLSTVHVNDSLKTLVFLGTPTHFSNSSYTFPLFTFTPGNILNPNV